jgi:hypothetical protein
MTVRRRAAAGSRPAWRCTGPLTALGKQSAARNSLRHGLNVPVSADPLLGQEVVELAERIADGSPDPETREFAVRVAEAQTDIQRVRDARHAVMGALIAQPGMAPEKTKELVVLDRYEKRAMSRRKSAILALGVERLLRDRTKNTT